MQTSSRSAKRFSLATLLILTAAAAGYFGGREHGFHQGKIRWQKLPESTRLYFVGDITQLNPETNINQHQMLPTLNQIATRWSNDVIPDNWKTRDDVETISMDATNKSLVVTGNPLVHAEVMNYLKYLRHERSIRAHGIGEMFD